MVELIDMDRFLELSETLTAIDVRSPIEYEQDHIPGSINIPLFSNEERAEIGTAYTHEGPETAVELGERYAEPKIPHYLEQVKSCAREGRVLVLCARGGMRSGRFSEFLAEHGYRPYRLRNGYKGYRRYVQSSFERKLSLIVLGGRTGCGKTDILGEMAGLGEQVLDLEGLANHRGSAFGSVGLGAQPSTRHFENCLFHEILRLDRDKPIWVEDESLNIGKVVLPAPFYDQLQSTELVLIDMDRSQRIERLCRDYGSAGKAPLIEALGKIRKRVGLENHQRALKAIEGDNLPEAVSLVLDYYDKCYDYYQESRNREIRCRITVEDGDMGAAARKIRDRIREC
jgi:tRNA 2-selenouridine synthase